MRPATRSRRRRRTTTSGMRACWPGDLVTALQMMEAAAPLLEGLSATYQAVVSQDRAEVLVAAGMPADAKAAFEQAARAYGSRGLRQRQAEVELILARTLAWDDPCRASTVARRAERRFRQRGSEAWALRAEGCQAGRRDRGRLPSAPRRLAGPPSSPRAPAQPRLRHDASLMTFSAARAELAAGDLAAAGAPARPRRVRDLRHHSPVRAARQRGAGRGGGGEGAGATGARPCPARVGGAARMAVDVRQPRPAELAGRPRAAAGLRRAPAGARRRPTRTLSSSGPSGPVRWPAG